MAAKRAYYNEHDKFAAAWLRELIKKGLIASGEVDERDIQQVEPEDLRGFTQCHFFAGIGVWSYALRAAGWPDDSRVWTGSCPCQGFSASGKREGFSDQRHLWPAWFRLIRQCRPDTIFGEQVASKDGLAWFDVVSADMEGEGYAIGAADTCAAGFGAPHIRSRLYFVAYNSRERCGEAWAGSGRSAQRLSDGGESSILADAPKLRHERSGAARRRRNRFEDNSEAGDMGHAEGNGRKGQPLRTAGRRPENGITETGFTNGFWRDAEWLWCRDQKYRPVEAGTFPLAHGIANRVGKLRGYGNALVAPQAQGFIEAYLEQETLGKGEREWPSKI